MDALELCNKINMEAESLADSGFPLEVFPQKNAVHHHRHGGARQFQGGLCRHVHAVGSISGSWQYLSYSR